MRAAEEKQYIRQNKWTAEKYDRYGFILPKEYKTRIDKVLRETGQSKSSFLKNAVIRALEEAEAETGD